MNTFRIASKFVILLLALLTAVAAIVPSNAQAAPAIQSTESIYIVQSGDTLYGIARRFATTVAALKSLNGLTSDRIYVGQRLRVSGNTTPAPQTYTVVAGDTLSSIARRFGTTVAAIQQANNLTTTRIYVGQRLRIPTGGGQTPPPAPQTYVVVAGDTLSSIARRFGTTVAAIQQANGLTTTRIYVGQRLRIPTGGGQTPPPAGAERITFAPGASSATVSGGVSAIAPKRYVLRALLGQAMIVNLQADNVLAHVAIIAPTGVYIGGGESHITDWRGNLPLDGDYVIEIKNAGDGLSNFTLTVAVH